MSRTAAAAAQGRLGVDPATIQLSQSFLAPARGPRLFVTARVLGHPTPDLAVVQVTMTDPDQDGRDPARSHETVAMTDATDPSTAGPRPLEGPDLAGAVGCDITEPDDAAHLIGTAQQRFGRLDVLVNVATLAGGRRRIEDLTDEDLRAFDRRQRWSVTALKWLRTTNPSTTTFDFWPCNAPPDSSATSGPLAPAGVSCWRFWG